MMYLSVPSWVIPGTYLENLKFLEDKAEIQGVELLFFLYDPEIKELLDKEWAGIEDYTHRFTFTAHLPETPHEELVVRLLPLTRHFILHPSPQAEDQSRLIHSWFERFGIERFLLENTSPGRLEALLPHLPAETRLCMDTGHLLLEGKSPARFFNRYGDRIREIHLHGVDPEQAPKDHLPDHRSICRDTPWFQELAPDLAGFTGIINLEVFSWEEVRRSIHVLYTCIERGIH